jgi:hypothetical protein
VEAPAQLDGLDERMVSVETLRLATLGMQGMALVQGIASGDRSQSAGQRASCSTSAAAANAPELQGEQRLEGALEAGALRSGRLGRGELERPADGG